MNRLSTVSALLIIVGIVIFGFILYMSTTQLGQDATAPDVSTVQQHKHGGY